jgi:PAS domain S-box-containing protein
MDIDFNSLLIDECPDAVIATSLHGEVLFWSRAAESIFGYSSAEVLGRTLQETIVPADRHAEERQIVSDALVQGSATHECFRRRKDGSLVYVDITSKVVREQGNGATFILTSKKDATQLKVLRDAKLVEARYGNLLESTPDGIALTSPTGRIVLANRQLETMFGYEARELRGQPVEILLPERFRRNHVGHRSKFFQQPRARPMGAGLQLYGRRKDGIEFPVEISLSPLETEEGTLVMSAIRDITDRKQFELALQEKNVELENANQAKDRFLATMSHELRTPLNAIIGFTGTLIMKLPGPLTAEQEKQLGTVQSSARHLLSLINDLLDLAKVEAGKIELRLESVVCQGVLEEVSAFLRPQAEKKGLSLQLTVPEAELRLQTDQRALSQIVLNLTNNAIKFTERGSVHLRLEQDGASGAIRIDVVDSGIGIRPEDQVKLFEAFAQVDSATWRRQEGTGLGLYLSQKLAALLGGRISFASEYGKGSTFTLLLGGS